MQYARYPFIDLAVHAAIRDRFAAGDALAVASPDLEHLIWANGAAARLFGFSSIYEFIEDGIVGRTALRRQIAAAITGLSRKPGQDFMIRSTTGFRNTVVPARVELMELPGGAPAVLISAPAPVILRGSKTRAQQVIRGFEGTETHIAVLDEEGQVLAASSSFAGVELSPAECLRMVEDVAGETDRLVKRMVSTDRGAVAAAIGRLTDDPALHLLFAVEPAEDAEPSVTTAGDGREQADDRAFTVDAADDTADDLWDAVPPQDLHPDLAETAGSEASDQDHQMPGPDDSSTEAMEDTADLARIDGVDPAAGEVDQSGSGFTFDPHARPVRFVWKIDRDGAFSETSPEFAAAVGPNAADIIGRKFPDIAQVFNLDPGRVIIDLLNRRDTWSGKTVYWPIQGTDLVAPVDLAALPTYTRDRTFDGFRGFGIVRISEARPDPEALGLALVPSAPAAVPAGTDMTDVPPAPEPENGFDAKETIAANAEMDAAQDELKPEPSDIEEAANEKGEAADPFLGERPALQIAAPTTAPHETDKVIDLGARRARTRDGLSPIEQAAFREIGARLGAAASEDTPVHPEPSSDAGKDTGESDEATLAGADSDLSAEEAEAPAADSESPAAEADGAKDAESREKAVAQSGEGVDEAQAAEAPPVPDGDLPDSAGTETIPSAFALPARQAVPYSMNESLIDAIPAALLVHAGDRLIHANSEFHALTGYDSLSDLEAAGGLDHLLDRPETDEGEANGLMTMRREGGSDVPVTARLRSINWHESQALLLALAPWHEAGLAPAEPAPAEEIHTEAEVAPQPAIDEASIRRLGALEVEASELRSILETATDGVAILDNDGTIRSMNGSACALFGYDESETKDQPFAMLFAHESQRAVMDYLTGLAEHGVSSVLNDGREVIGREANGGFLPLFMTMGRLTGSNGYCAVLRDITQWKRSEEELRSAKRAAETANSHKSEFLARVSHEIRTPLNAIIGFSEMMVGERFGPIGNSRYLEYAHDIGSSGRHVLDIVNDLLDISKIEAGEVDLEFSAVSINDQLAECVSMLQPMANAQRVIIRTSLSASVPEVVADSRSIKQIALNILSNAIRYTPSGGQIVVSTSYEASGNVVLRIRDTGVGMTRKELEQAMKPFGQVGPGPRQRGDGTGLGLPLTKAMVEANRAQFEIVSAPSDGTLITVTFPPQRVLAD